MLIPGPAVRPRAHFDWFNLFCAAPGGASCKPDGFDSVAQRSGGNGDACPPHRGQAPCPVAVPVQVLPVDERDGVPDVGFNGHGGKNNPAGAMRRVRRGPIAEHHSRSGSTRPIDNSELSSRLDDVSPRPVHRRTTARDRGRWTSARASSPPPPCGPPSRTRRRSVPDTPAEYRQRCSPRFAPPSP